MQRNPIFQTPSVRALLFRLLSTFAIVAVIGAAWMTLELLKPVPQEKPRKVKKLKVFIQPVKAKTTHLTVSAQGIAEPKSEIQLRSEVEGKAVYVSPAFVAGGQFSAGDLLVKLDPQDYELIAIQRRARVTQTKEALQRVRAESENAIEELTLLNRTEASDLAKKLPQLARAEADVASAEAALKQAEINLARTEIRAPFNGMVRKESVAPGQFINRAFVLATIFSVSETEIRLPLRGEQLSQLALPLNYFASPEQSKFTVALSADVAGERGQWTGKIVRTEGVMDKSTRTVYAVVHVDTPYATDNGRMPLVAGMYVNAQIKGRAIKDAVTLPRKAIRTDSKVWLVDKNETLQIEDVTVVSRDHQNAVVTGLSGKNRVITSALVMAVEGLPVRAIDPSKSQSETEDASPLVPKLNVPSSKTSATKQGPSPKKAAKGKIGGGA